MRKKTGRKSSNLLVCGLVVSLVSGSLVPQSVLAAEYESAHPDVMMYVSMQSDNMVNESTQPEAVL